MTAISQPLNVGVLGLGYWGPNLVRNFHQCPTARLVAIADQQADRREHASFLAPEAVACTSLDELLEVAGLEAVSVATPVSTHFDLAMQAIEAGKHVLVEKPIADTYARSRRLIDAAEAQGVLLMVDHTFPYTPAVRKIQELIRSGSIGELRYYDSTRINLGLFQHDVNVIWDLAVHDLSILEVIMPEPPIGVSATGISHVEGKPENIAYLTLFYPDKRIAHIHVNWLAPVKIRQTLIGGTEKMIVYDDTELTEKIKVYDKGISVAQDPEAEHLLRVSYRAGDMFAPHLESREALASLAEHFVDCVRNGTRPITDAESAARTVRIMEAATESMAQSGTRIELVD